MERFDLRGLPDTDLPMALADAHWQVTPPDSVEFRFRAGMDQDLLADILEGAGFKARGSAFERLLSLPDTVAPDMALLVCGLNPSIHAAEMGVGFGRGGNRFWPAALDVGLVTVDRDPRRALLDHGVGMTDLVKRATRRADELDRDEYRLGIERIERLVRWLRPAAICFVGLAGWRAAVDKKAAPGAQPGGLGDTPVYVMPSTSGLNAHSGREDLGDHLRSAATLGA